MHQSHHSEHHPLIPCGQVIQHFPRLFPLLLQVVGHHRGEVVVAVLPPLPVGDVGLHPQQAVLHFPHGLIGGDRDHVDGQHHGAVQAGEFIDHGVLDVAGILLEEHGPAIFIAQDKVILPKLHAVRADGVLEGTSCFHALPQVDMKPGLLAHPVKVVEHTQPLHRVQLLTVGIQVIEPGSHIIHDPVEEGPGLLGRFLMGGYCDISLLHYAVGGVGDLVQQHGVVLRTAPVQMIPLGRDQDLLLKVAAVEPLVVNGDFGGRAGVQGIEQFRVAQEHGDLVLFGSDGVIDVGKADGFREFPAKLKKPIRPEAVDGDGILYGLWHRKVLFVLLQCVLKSLNQVGWPPLLMCVP